MAIRIEDRDRAALKVQEVLTRHGCNISMRLGLHDSDEGVCGPSGTLILQLCCTAEEGKKVEADLVKIEGVKAQFIDLK
jgi:hypothetical protein